MRQPQLVEALPDTRRADRDGPPFVRLAVELDQKLNCALTLANRGCSTEFGRSQVAVNDSL